MSRGNDASGPTALAGGVFERECFTMARPGTTAATKIQATQGCGAARLATALPILVAMNPGAYQAVDELTGLARGPFPFRRPATAERV